MRNFENLTVTDYFSILRRRIWYVIGTAFLVGVATFLYVWQMKPNYVSETTIFVAGRLIPENYVESIVRDTNQERIEFARQQLQSRTFIERIVSEFQLAGPDADRETVINVVRARTVLTPLTATAFRLSFSAPDPVLAQNVTRRLADRVIQLNENFRKEIVLGTDQFMDEQFNQAKSALTESEEKLRKFYSDHYPGVPRDGVNLDSLSNLQAQLASADSNLQNLQDRRRALERRLEEQRQLKSVGRAQAPQAPAANVTEHERPAPVAPPSQLELKLATKRTELKEKSLRYTAAHPEIIALTQEVKDLESQVNDERAQLARSTPAPRGNATAAVRPPDIGLPQVDTSDFIQAEIDLELQRVNKDIAAADAVKRQMSSRVSLYQSRINPSAELAQELATLNREFEIAKQQYTDISARKAKAGLASEADTSGNSQVFKIVDEPNLPRHSSGPAKRMVLGGGCFLGLLLGFGAAVGRELLDNSLLTEEDAARDLKIPVLTSLPEVDGDKSKSSKKRKEPKPLVPLSFGSADPTTREFGLQHADAEIRNVITNSMGIAGEQFRLLRTKLSAMQKTVGLKSIMVTSAAPNEGKTFSATCLSAIMAQEPGKRILLVDADLRTANAGVALGVGRGTFGLSDLLRDSMSVTPELFESSLVKHADSKWYFLPAGPLISNPAELLSTPAFESLMRMAYEQFDWVVVDSPPVLAVSDANLLAGVCGGALFVMHGGKTPASLIKEAVGRIGPERICGLVMNRMRNLKLHHYYSYYQKQTTS